MSGLRREQLVVAVMGTLGMIVGILPGGSTASAIPPTTTVPGDCQEWDGDCEPAPPSSTSTSTTVPANGWNCSQSYINWYSQEYYVSKGVGSDAKTNWTGCVTTTAYGIDPAVANQPYTIKIPYLRSSSNPTARNGRKDVIFAHGATFDGDGWTFACRYLLTKYPESLFNCWAPHLAGMGGSGYPGGNMQDWLGWSAHDLDVMKEIEFAGSLDAALKKIKSSQSLALGQSILVGYSNGGLTIQMLEDQLQNAGTSLRAKYGIDKTVLMASVLPHDVCWPAVDDIAMAELFGAQTPFTGDCDAFMNQGTVLDLLNTIFWEIHYDWNSGNVATPEPNTNDAQWVDTWWSEPGEEGNISSNYSATRNGRLPTNSESSYVTNWFGFTTFNEMIGNNDFFNERPSVPGDMFANDRLCYDRDPNGIPCERLVSVVFDQDKYITPGDVSNLHTYLARTAPTCVTSTVYVECLKVKGTHGAAFSLFASAWDSYASTGMLKSGLDPVFDSLVKM